MFGSEREKSIKKLHDEKGNNFNDNPDSFSTAKSKRIDNMGRACKGDKCLNVVGKHDNRRQCRKG